MTVHNSVHNFYKGFYIYVILWIIISMHLLSRMSTTFTEDIRNVLILLKCQNLNKHVNLLLWQFGYPLNMSKYKQRTED